MTTTAASSTRKDRHSLLVATFFCAALTVACSAGKGDIIFPGAKHKSVDFSASVELLYAADSLIGDQVMGASYVYTLNDSLLALQYPDGESFFSIIGVDGGYRSTFLKRGRGPSEASSCGALRVRHGEDNVFMDVSTTTGLLSFPLDSVLAGNPRAGSLEYGSLSMDGDIAKAFYTSNDEIVCYSLYDKDIISYKIYNCQSHSLAGTFIPFGLDDKTLLDSQSLLTHTTLSSIDGTKACLMMRYFDIVGIWDIGTGKVIKIPGNSKPDNQLWDSAEASKHKYYLGGCVDQDNIYCLFSPGIASSREDRVVRRFNWDGDIVATYRLQEPVHHISVTADGKMLFGITPDEIIYCYPLDEPI